MNRLSIASLLCTCAFAPSPALAQFGPPVALPSQILQLHSLTAADVDGDNDLDLLGADTPPFSKVHRLENLGGGVYAPAQEVSADQYIDPRVATGDMNGDGDLDLVIADTAFVGAQPNVFWMAGDGAGLFAARVPIGQALVPGNLLVADMDGDGDLDIITAGNLSPATLEWFENLGSAVFAAPDTIDTGLDLGAALDAQDLDGDGRVDLLATSAADIAWYPGTAQGPGAKQVAIADGSQFAVVANLNGDAFPDVAYSSDATGEFLWIAGAGGGNFGGSQFIGGAGLFFGTALCAADFTNDGVDDVVGMAISIGSAPLHWYENDGSGVFSAAMDILPTNAVFHDEFLTFDVDEDADVDLLYPMSWHPNLDAPWTEYCSGVANSTGAGAVMSVSGSTVVNVNSMSLHASSLPTSVFGFFMVSETQGFVSGPGGSAGDLCLAGAIGRFNASGQIQFSGAPGLFALAVDLAALPHPQSGTVAVLPGESWNFQAWYRDTVNGMPTSNFTSALAVQFQ